MSILPDYSNDELYYTRQTGIMSPEQEAIEGFRMIFKAKISEAFRDYPVSEKGRWVVILGAINKANDNLKTIIKLRDNEIEALEDYVIESRYANEDKDMESIRANLKSYLRVFERRWEPDNE